MAELHEMLGNTVVHDATDVLGGGARDEDMPEDGANASVRTSGVRRTVPAFGCEVAAAFGDDVDKLSDEEIAQRVRAVRMRRRTGEAPSAGA